MLSGTVLAALGAVLAAGLGALGAAIGIGYSGSAMIGTVAEKPETFSKAMISVVLAEALAIYGLLASFMIIMRLGEIQTFSQGLLALASGIAIGLATIGGGYGIARAGSSMCTSIAESPETFSKSLVAVVLAEALAIYGLLVSFMLIMRIPDASTDPFGVLGQLGLAAAIAVGLAAIGGGYAIAKGGAALCRSVAESPGIFSKGLVAVVLAEALAIYGLLISFMITMRITPLSVPADPALAIEYALRMQAQSILALSSGIGIGIAAVGGGIGIALGGAALCKSLTKAPEIFSKGLVSVVLAEALAIYGLLAAFMLIMRLDVMLTLDPLLAIERSLIGMAAALTVGVGGVCAGLAIGLSGRAMINAMETEPGVFSKSMVPVVLAEALAIYTLLVAFMLIMQI